MKQFKDMRSLCLKIIFLVLNKYEDQDFGSGFWDLFFKSVKPLINRFKQEGSSSEKQSSLFFCFLAMSQSQNLISLLFRENNLIPDIISILSVPTASEAIVFSVLKFTENLLNLELEIGIGKNDVREVLLSSLDVLIDSLHHLFHLNPEKKRYVSSLACDKPNVCMEALKILKEIIPVLGCENTSKILNAVSPILISARLDVRLSVCDLCDALTESDSSLRSMSNLIRELNATSAMEIDALDFDTIINAYDQISEDYFKGVREDQAIVILSHCIFDMMSEDLTLRQRAYGSLLSFIDFSALLVGNKEKNQEQQIMAVDGISWTDAHIQRIVDKFLLKHMGDAISIETMMRKVCFGLRLPCEILVDDV
ncbi:hypothetical protein Cgig2_030411 [Carnegiea gigantea]|uniref:U3 small nucleolar RNA-associated protein 20 N-terminal domain-containing protein n=1 Tax=Carnegiea gigantea TaxID=171969 RepID=A0A9Q1KLA2_9CARY|nr:hypothetical protein Cgig2_030411 [Carnegiea gigantea]